MVQKYRAIVESGKNAEYGNIAELKKRGLNMSKGFLFVVAVLTLPAMAASVQVELLTHTDNKYLLPQTKAIVGVSGDHLLHTSDDITGSSFNPSGCASFNLMNPVGEMLPDYPPGYAEGIHSMTGSMTIDVDLGSSGTTGVDVQSLAFDGYVALGKQIAHQHLVQSGDPAADGTHGPVYGTPNSGTYAGSATSNWAFQMTMDWYYDTQFAGPNTIDMTFNDYQWNGFIIPVTELTAIGMAATTLDDPLGYFGGTSEDFEQWILDEVAGQLPTEAGYLFFAQGEAHPIWTHPMMGMTTDGIIAETIVGYVVPEPTSFSLVILALSSLAVRRSRRKIR